MNEAIATGKVLDIHQDSFLKKKRKRKKKSDCVLDDTTATEPN